MLQKMGLFYKIKSDTKSDQAEHSSTPASDQVVYVVKGSEGAIMKCLSREQQDSPAFAEALTLGHNLASQGMRILSVAYKTMSSKQYEDQKLALQSANTADDIARARFDCGMQFAGLMCNSDPLAPNVRETARNLKLGDKIMCAICSGDRFETTAYAARGRHCN